MVAGFRALTEDGIVQITDEDINFSMFENGVLPSTGWTAELATSGSGAAEQYDLTISGYSLTDCPMLALSCERGTWHNILSSSPTSLTFRIYRSAFGGDSTVKWYLFINRVIPNSNGAMIILRNSSGQIVYSTAYPVARPLGIVTESGYSGAPLSGKLCAHVPIKQSYLTYRTISSGTFGSCNTGAGPGYQVYETFGVGRGTVSARIGAANTSTNRGYSYTSIPLYCSNQNESMSGSLYSEQVRSLILDVTNY